MQLEPHHNVVIYALPGGDGFRYCHQEDFGASHNLDVSNPAFIARPYSDAVPMVCIKAEVDRSFQFEEVFLPLKENTLQIQTEKEVYVKMVMHARDAASAADGKVVLSRIKDQHFGRFDVVQSLKHLREKFPDALVYLLHTEAYGTWMGATPEVLLSQEGADFVTMALAGTKWNDEPFEQKEFDEQMLVTKDILEILSEVAVEVGDVQESKFGELSHLRTMIRWQSPDTMIDFAQRLHPTPAVCGYPRPMAKETIGALELHNRSLYTGYLGFVKPRESSSLFVNLRCIQLFHDRFWKYAGGGINADS
ncbi:MAG: chorismate-binding protein, partial [Salibacteraceae bacterium]